MARPVIIEQATLDYSSMTIADLMKEAMRVATVLELCNDTRIAIFAVIEARKADVKARAAVVGMTAIEKDALAVVVRPESQ